MLRSEVFLIKESENLLFLLLTAEPLPIADTLFNSPAPAWYDPMQFIILREHSSPVTIVKQKPELAC